MADKLSKIGNVCLDASVVIKLLIREKDSDTSAYLFERLVQQNSKIFEPTFLKVEVYSTLRKKSYLKQLPGRIIRTSLKFFEELPLDYKLEDKSLLDNSLKLAERLSMPVIYDCLYLALAQQEKATFITADERFVKKAKRIYKNSLSLSEIASGD